MTRLAEYAHTALGKLDTLFEAACRGLAEQCSDSGNLSTALMDRRQLPCYELAIICAEIMAARTVSDRTRDSARELDQALGFHFIAEAIQSVKGRFEPLLQEFNIDRNSFDACFSDSGLIAFVQEMLSAQRLEESGKAVIDCSDDIGFVELDTDKVMMQDAFRRLAGDRVAPLAEKIHRQDLTVPEELLQLYRETGVFGLSVPEKYGGIAPDDREDNLSMIVVTEALSEASLAAGGSLITRPEIMAKALLSGGTDAQKATWLPKIARGDPLCAIAITEPDYGSDVAGLKLKGVRVEGGWVLNGPKTWCTFAGRSGLLLVLARTDPDRSLGHKGLSVFLVEKESFDTHEFVHEQEDGGRLAGKAIPTIGYRGMHSFDLSFEDFLVPDANLLGGEEGLGKGFYFTMSGLTGGRIQTAARATGVMRAALGEAIRHARDRKVFGAPLGDYQLTRAKLARMAARVAACRQFTYVVGGVLDAGKGSMEASLVKLFACRSAELITREAVQVHGGMGYAEETPVSRYFVDARVLSIFEGAEETLALKVVARELLHRALAC